MLLLKVEKLLSAALKTPLVFLFVCICDFCTTLDANGSGGTHEQSRIHFDFVGKIVQNNKLNLLIILSGCFSVAVHVHSAA